ncbi:MAG: hypothetical protein ACM3Q0_07830 [Bacteroidota bacterium]
MIGSCPCAYSPASTAIVAYDVVHCFFQFDDLFVDHFDLLVSDLQVVGHRPLDAHFELESLIDELIDLGFDDADVFRNLAEGGNAFGAPLLHLPGRVSSTFCTSAVPPAMATAIAAEPIAPRTIAVVLSIVMEPALSEPVRRTPS